MDTHNLPAAPFAALLRRLSACDESRAWQAASTLPEWEAMKPGQQKKAAAAGLDYATAWQTCHRGDWLLWLLDAAAPLDAKANELLICRFAREVLHLNPDPRVLTCIETREAWARGEATDAAWAAARAAAGDAARDAAGDAARAAARAKQAGIIRELVPMPALSTPR